MLIPNLPIPLIVAASCNTRRAFLGGATSVVTTSIMIDVPPVFAQEDDDGTLS
jgi:hypothetical protein